MYRPRRMCALLWITRFLVRPAPVRFHPLRQGRERRLPVTIILLADSCNLWSDAFIPFKDFTPRDKDFHLMWELARFLVMNCACSMVSMCAASVDSGPRTLDRAPWTLDPGPDQGPGRRDNGKCGYRSKISRKAGR